MSAVAAQFDATPDVPEREPDYNVSPREDIYAVLDRPGEAHQMQRRLTAMRWGLIPWWAKEAGIGDRLINARAESVTDKPAFRDAFRRQRCIVPADGFYEWRSVPGTRIKQPTYIRRVDGEQLAFAGLWERWRDPEDPDGRPIETCTIITTEANAIVAPIHDRMPVILERGAWDMWLDPEWQDTSRLQAVLRPAPDAVLEAYPVDRRVNSPRNNGPELIVPAEPDSLF